jgi:hypothetical protein
MSIRRVAFATFIAAVLGMLMPFWNAAQTMNSVVSTHPLWKWWMIPAMVLVVVFSAIMPVFYLALYRHEEALRFPTHLRPLSLAAALLLTIITVSGSSTWATAFGGNASVLTEARDNWNISQIAPLFGGLSNIAYVLLLITLFQHSTEEFGGVPFNSALLSFVTKVAVMLWGVILVFNFVHLVALTPYTYFQIRGYALQMGRKPPELRDMMAQSLRTLIEQACLFTAPFIVYRSTRRRRQEPALPTLDAPPAS